MITYNLKTPIETEQGTISAININENITAELMLEYPDLIDHESATKTQQFKTMLGVLSHQSGIPFDIIKKINLKTDFPALMDILAKLLDDNAGKLTTE